MKTIEEIRNRLTEISVRMGAVSDFLTRNAEAEAPEDVTEYRKEVDELMTERKALMAKEAELIRSADFNAPGAKMPTAKKEECSEDIYGSEAYRKEFQDYMQRGVKGELITRATAQTNVTAVVVPTTITSQLFVSDQQSGTIYDKVTKTNYQFGVEYPISDSTFEIQWVAERATATDSSATATSKITFTGFKGQIKFPISYEVSIKALPDFELAMAQKMLEGMRLSFDKIILTGDGASKPTGILTDATYTGTGAKVVQFNSTNISDYQTHLTAFAKVPMVKKSSVAFVINNTDWLTYIVGMKDDNNRVIAFDTVGFGGMPQPVFMGRPVVLLENQGLSTYDSITGAATASKTTCFGAWVKLEDYYLNMNAEPTMRKYIDEDTDDIVTKMTLLADGKMISTTSIVTLCKKAEPTS